MNLLLLVAALCGGFFIGRYFTKGASKVDSETPGVAGNRTSDVRETGAYKYISADGSQVLISDMNGIAGWDRVGTAWQPTSEYPHYIHH